MRMGCIDHGQLSGGLARDEAPLGSEKLTSFAAGLIVLAAHDLIDGAARLWTRRDGSRARHDRRRAAQRRAALRCLDYLVGGGERRTIEVA